MRNFLYGAAATVLLLAGCAGPVRRTPHGFRTDGPTARFEVVCYAPEIIQVLKAPLYSEVDTAPTASVTMKPGKVRFDLETLEGGVIRLTTEALRVELDPVTAVYSFYLPDGTLLVREQSEAVSHEEIYQGFLLEPGEAMYGLGQHRGGGLDQRRKNYHLENVNMEIAIPLFHSVKGYAVYWDNYSPTEFQSDEDGVSFSSEAGKNCSYFFLGGGSGDAVVRNIRTLTGRVPMNPLWQFGFLQSKERYGSAEELVSVVKKYRALQVPLDGIVQDWQYWGDNAHWNAVEFLNPAYPDPKGMMDEIHSLHAHALISVWPSFGPESNIYQELLAENLLLGQSTFPQGNGVRVYDPWNPRAREIFWNYMEKNIWSVGVDGWWLDATEPEHQPVRPEDYDYRSPEGTYREMRNSFPLYSVGGVYDHQRALTSDRRVSILTRSATVGLQRYGAHVWSGDLESTWTSLKEQVQEALNLSLCGIPFWNADIGGFFAGAWPGGNQNPGFRQLYGRWMQFAAFTGMMRSHGTNTPREIFQFGGPGDPDFDLQEKYIRLRYRLLPYTYSAVAAVTREDASLMRALFLDYPEDRRTWDEDTEFLYGKSILVAPVSTEDDTRSVYLPEGEWIGFWDGVRLNGGVTFNRTFARDELPLYVKAGAVVPMGPEVQYAAEKPWDDLQIRVYTGADGSFSLYEDEGDGYGYEKGACSSIAFDWDDAAGVLTIGPRQGAYPGMSAERSFRIVIVRPGAGTGLDNTACDREVRYTGAALTVDMN